MPLRTKTEMLETSFRIRSDVVLESGSVLESDSSTYFEDSDSDSNPLDSDSDLDSD